MRKLYKEYFYVPKHAKIREKVIVSRLISMLVIIIFSLVGMSISAYAFFSHEVTSRLSMIKSACFETKLIIQIIDNGGKVVEEIIPITSNYKTFKISGLEPNRNYTVKITPTEQSSATTGFVIVRATNSVEVYHTQQLGVDKNAMNGRTDELNFTLSITNPSDVIFESHWGTSTYYLKLNKLKENDNNFYIIQGERIEIG